MGTAQEKINKLTEYQLAQAQAKQERISLLKKIGKQSAVQRLNALFDEGSFIELGTFVGKTAENGLIEATVVTGYGAIDGRLTYAFAQDMVTESGALDTKQIEKIEQIVKFAISNVSPLVAIFDSFGGRVNEGLLILNEYARLLNLFTKAKDVIPMVSIICGTCGGIASLLANISDFIIMSENNGELFINSFDVLNAVTGEKLMKKPNVHLTAPIEVEAIGFARTLLSYLPANNLEGTIVELPSDDINRLTPEIIESLDNGDVRSIISCIADTGTFIELSGTKAKNAVTAFLKLNGAVIGVVANQAIEKDGVIDIKGAKKMIKFISFCNNFKIPYLTVVNTIGIEFSAKSEYASSVFAKLATVFASGNVAKVTLYTGKAYANGYTLMAPKALGADVAYALPTAQISVLDPKLVVNFLEGEKIATFDNVNEGRSILYTQYADSEASPYKAAELGLVDDVITPEITRQVIVGAFEMLSQKK